MRRLIRILKRINYRHYICFAITVGFLLCGVFLFFGAVGRLIESSRDFGLSCGYYFCEVFMIPHNITLTVNSLPQIPFFPSLGFLPSEPSLSIPDNWQGFTEKWYEYWQVWATDINFIRYIIFVGDILYYFSLFIMVVLPILLILIFLFRQILKKKNNNYGDDTRPLKIYKKLVSCICVPVKGWIVSFIVFIKDNGVYWKIWVGLWLFYFNAYTIILEFLAYYLYFAVSFDFISLYIQVYKFLLDIWVVIEFIPLSIWVIIGLFVVDYLRKKIGYAVLNHNEMKNRGFINARPIVLMVCGTMGKKKTTMITDMALSQSVMLKDKAFEKILENDFKFPYFPWILLEKAVQRGMDRHYVYNLATCRKLIKHLAACFYVSQDCEVAVYKSIRRHLKRRYNLTYDNFLFGYDYERYGFTYNNKQKVVTVWDVLEIYAQLYFIYVIQSSLIIGNYSVRTDSLISDIGNFPLWNSDFFKRDSRLIDSFSRHSHIIDFDSLRLGRKVIENNPYADSFEFGVINITEVGKERKNTLELKEQKKNDGTTNQKNDGFNDWLKMIRHSATVDNFPFVKVITDEQRPESWGADARDLCEIVHIRQSGETRLAMPFFFIGELLYSFVFSHFEKIYYEYRYTRGDNTLSMYILKTIASKIQKYYTDIYNIFGYCSLRVQVESGTQDGEIDEGKYYLASKKIYSKRFSTDCFSDFFTVKALRSNVGIDDLPEYKTEKATFDEMKQQNSYFINELNGRQNSEG